MLLESVTIYLVLFYLVDVLYYHLLTKLGSVYSFLLVAILLTQLTMEIGSGSLKRNFIYSSHLQHFLHSAES